MAERLFTHGPLKAMLMQAGLRVIHFHSNGPQNQENSLRCRKLTRLTGLPLMRQNKKYFLPCLLCLTISSKTLLTNPGYSFPVISPSIISCSSFFLVTGLINFKFSFVIPKSETLYINPCLLYTSDAADERSSVDL